MTESSKNTPKENPQAKIMGRRELLKALAATGGAVTAVSLLPGKWAKPVVEAGVLPAHAQTTGDLRISSLSVGLININSQEVEGQGVPISFPYQARFNYDDTGCAVDSDTLLFARSTADDTLFNGTALTNIGGATVGSDPCAGQISFPFISSAYLNIATLTVKINAGGRDSNEISADYSVSS